ncbi:helix-turn-helix transcriptional regulator [Herbaspirillum sp. AP02]|uniref:AraC family transcriptional regulator n=1 Tax=unclassified Herbaspirillum TaxID=2624150 RepID=UPI0015DBA7B1|nr:MULTISPECIES: AraC family transcriptional regulator [unclassified Herbaspirillum]MBG7620149.1 helix-turn-helix transcriptional regulator [Herbaspirillum sp. AP02]NZD69401.1 helix-turn-helix transcriptional regulator [Herbaspirillum sp. AP21]
MKHLRIRDDIALVRAVQEPSGLSPAPPPPVIDIPSDEAFSVIVQLRDFPHHKLWRGQQLVHSGTHHRGDIAITDLREQWRCQHLSDYDNVRLHLPRTTIEQLSEEGGRRISGLDQVQAIRDPVVWHLIHAMLPALGGAANDSDTVFIDTVTLALHTHLSQRYGGQPVTRTSGRLAGWQQVRAREYMLAHLAQRLTLAEIAAHCGVSRAHFARAFKHSFGMPPHAWLQRQRVTLACRLLRESDRGMTAIALECGFFDQSHFSRVFKQLKGMAPAAWVRMQR